MSPLRRWALILLGLGVTLGCAIPIPTVQPLTRTDDIEVVKTLALDGASSALVRLRLLSQYLSVSAADDAGTEQLLTGRFVYNVEEWAPNIEQETTEGQARVTIDQGVGSQIPLGRDGKHTNRWEIGLTRGIPLELDVDMGAGEAQLDLTGLHLTRFTLTSGSTDATVVFNEANPEPMSLLRLTAGAGKVSASGLGNANFDRASIFGGAGMLELDLGGTYRRSAVAEIRAGAGKVTIHVPSDIGVRITAGEISLAEVETVGLTQQNDGAYVNAAYGQSPLTLTIRLTAGVGAISLISD